MTLLGLIVSLGFIFYTQGMINDVLQSEDLNFSITDKDGYIVLEFYDLCSKKIEWGSAFELRTRIGQIR